MQNSSTSELIAAYADRVEHADVYGAAVQTPLDAAPRLSKRLANDVLLKREDLQPVFSFKCRGARNKIARLPESARRGGVICSSAGNHAQGVALAAAQHGIRAVVVMPQRTASIKVDAVEALGAEIVLAGEDYDGAYAEALALAEGQKLEFIHPFADPDVIAGQGTIARELAQQWSKVPEAVFVPVGGGGLISGIGTYLKHRYPSIKIIGVEPTDAPSMHAALHSGAPVTLDRVGIFADGVAVRRVADETFRIAREIVDEIILVDTDASCAAIKDIFEDTRTIAEPAGALAVAGMKHYVERCGCQEESLIAIVSGANINFDRLRHVSERAEIGEHREALIAVEIPERPGAFLTFCRKLGQRNITEFNYRFAATRQAHIFVGVSLSGHRDESRRLAELISSAGYQVRDLGDNELAKLHIRHMVGGQVPTLNDESIFRFEFPERPGALLSFLEAIGTQWNISLFHYRNHGSDYGRVLAGVQVPPGEQTSLKEHLDALGYPYWPETDNPAYQLFLAPQTD